MVSKDSPSDAFVGQRGVFSFGDLRAKVDYRTRNLIHRDSSGPFPNSMRVLERMKHVAIAVEQAYGHILPTVGIAMELVSRGHRVSYAVTKEFGAGVTRIGARPLVFDPIVTRPAILTSIADGNPMAVAGLRLEKTENSLSQLEGIFQSDRPDLIIHDACEDFAGRSLAMKWGIPHVRVSPVPPTSTNGGEMEFEDDSVVLVMVPKFFCDRLPTLHKDKIKVIGFAPEGRDKFFEPWKPAIDGRQLILVSVTTGILAQTDFCRTAIEAFRGKPFRVVLSIGGLDRVSRITLQDLGDIPENVEINQSASNFAILRHAVLLITQGGQGSILEALHCGVPVLTAPNYFWDEDASNVIAQLGLGARLAHAEEGPEKLRETAVALLNDTDTRARVGLAKRSMHNDHAARAAADVVDTYL